METKTTPNRLGAILRYFTDAFAFARPAPSVHPSKSAHPPSAFRPQLDALAQQYYPAAEPVDAAALWRLAVLSPWLGPNLQLIANRLTAVPLAMKRRQQERLEDIPNHPVERLLAAPNPLWPGTLIWQYGIVWYLLRGNAYWFLATPAPGQGEPQEVWALDSSQVRPRPDLLHQGRGAFKGRPIIDYELTIQGRIYPLPGENVIHWRTANPFDYWEGLSPLNAAAQGLQIDYTQADWLKGFYGEDNAVPTAIISLPPEIDDATFEAAKDQIREQFSQKRRSAVTRAGDLTVQVIEQALKDMEMVASREFNGKVLDRVYGIPEGLISGGLSGDSRLAAEVAFARNTVQPLLTSLASALDSRLTPYWGDPDLVLTAPDITPADRSLDLQEFTIHSPFLSLNEARERIGKSAYTHDLADVPLRLLDLIAKETQRQPDAETQSDAPPPTLPASPAPSPVVPDRRPPSLPGADAPANVADREAAKSHPPTLPASHPLPEPAALAAVAAELVTAAETLGATLKHYGPGDHPNGSPQSEHGRKQEQQTTVGITSYGDPQNQPAADHTSQDTFERMHQFEADLKAIPGVSAVRVQPGRGGWAGGWEPTWVVTYRGNGEALRLLASYGKQYQQQAILVLRPGTGRPVFTYEIDTPIKPALRAIIEQAMPQAKINGWTWYRLPNGKRALRLVSVPEWDAAIDQSNARSFSASLRKQGIHFRRRSKEVGGFLMTEQGEHSYDTYIQE